MSQDIDVFLSTRKVGDAEITIWYESIGSGVPRFNVSDEMLREAIPEYAEAGEMEAAMTTTIVRIGDAIVVIDPALDDPDSRLGKSMSSSSTWRRSPGLQTGLDVLGIANEQVTHVIITHAHFDHCLGVTIERDDVYIPRFPNARYFMGKAELQLKPDADSDPPTPEEDRFGYLHHVEMWPRLQAIDDASLLELVEGTRVIAPGAEMIHAPGETPGHYVVRVSSDDEVFYHLGDLVHGSFEFEHPGWIMVDSLERDVETMEATRLQLMPQVVRDNAVAFFGHAPPPGWGKLVEHGAGFRWKTL